MENSEVSSDTGQSQGIDQSPPQNTTSEQLAKMWKVVVDGQEMEVDEKELVSNYTHRKGIEAKAREASDIRKQAEEVLRIFKNGRLIPQIWMKEAVGSELSDTPILEAVREALKVVK